MKRSGNRQVLGGSVSGFTLTEVLIYMAIMSLVMTGVGALVMNMKRSQVTVQNLARDFGDRDIAIRAMQVKLGKSDQIQIDNVTAGDRACLRLRERSTETQAGAWFDGEANYVQSIAPVPVAGNAARSITLWAWPDLGQNQYMGLVHWGSAGLSRNKFSFGVKQGFFELDFGCERWRSAIPAVTHGRWNHITISYDGNGVTTANSLRLFVDGTAVTLTQIAGSPPCSGGAALTTSASHFWVGTGSSENGTLFRGGVHDVRLWSQALSNGDAQTLYATKGQGSAQIAATQTLHWPLFHDNLTRQVVDSTANGIHGDIYPPVDLIPIHNTARDTYATTGFCFYDDNANGLYDLWYGTVTGVVPPASGAAGWRQIGADIFVPGDSGFFGKPDQSAHSVTANFAVGTNPVNRDTLTQKTETVNLTTQANNTVGRRCTIGMVNKLRALNCRFESAYIAIVDGFDAGNDRLDIANLIGNGGYTSSQTVSVPPSVVTGVVNTQIFANWFHDIGVLHIMSPNATFNDLEWRAIMEKVELRTRTDNYTSEKTVRISLGGLAHINQGKSHFYRFNAANFPGVQHTYSLAKAMIDVGTQPLCGMAPYMATITSQQEQDHIFKALRVQGEPALSGWLGAVESPDGLWQWQTGPESGHYFWQHGYGGLPVSRDGVLITDPAARTISGIDHMPAETGNEWRRKVSPQALGHQYRYTNFSHGTTSSNCGNNGADCEPHILPGYQHNLTMQTTVAGGNLWHSSHDIYAFCNGGEKQICGAYVEFGGMASDPNDVTLAIDIPVNVVLQRDLCGIEP